MDDKSEVTTDTGEQTEAIRQNIEETRSALAEKLETLEQQVVDTVQETTSAVAETVGNVKEVVQETVEGVKDTVEETVATVKGTVQSTVEAVKDTFNIRRHVERYPWPMFGGSIGLGFAVGMLIPARRADRAAEYRAEDFGAGTNGRAEQPGAREAPSYAASAYAAATPAATTPIRPGGYAAQVEQERAAPHRAGFLQQSLQRLKNIAIGAAIGAANELIEKNVGGDLGKQLTDWLDGLNQQLGGEAIRQPLSGAQAGGNGRHSDARHSDDRERAAAERTYA